MTAKKRALDPATREADRTEQHPNRDSTEGADGLQVALRVPYGTVDGRDLTLDSFTPEIQPRNARPAIVFLHGGCWWKGSPSQFHFHAARLARRYGFFAVSVDYRLSQEAPFLAALQDAKCAVRWIRMKCDQYNIDPNRIAVCGGSAGAHLSSMILATSGIPEYEGSGGNEGYSSHVNLGILFNGEFDMWDLVQKGSLTKPMEQFMGGTPDEVPERYTELSSINRIHVNVPPVLMLHGTEDICVSHEQSVALHDKLSTLGVHAELELYPGKRHAWFNAEPDRTTTAKRMERFLVEQFNLE